MVNRLDLRLMYWLPQRGAGSQGRAAARKGTMTGERFNPPKRLCRNVLPGIPVRKTHHKDAKYHCLAAAGCCSRPMAQPRSRPAASSLPTASGLRRSFETVTTVHALDRFSLTRDCRIMRLPCGSAASIGVLQRSCAATDCAD